MRCHFACIAYTSLRTLSLDVYAYMHCHTLHGHPWHSLAIVHLVLLAARSVSVKTSGAQALYVCDHGGCISCIWHTVGLTEKRDIAEYLLVAPWCYAEKS